MKLCLGTVQFGMDYGVRGQKKPSLADAMEMLDYALHNGADAIDTANAYGEAEAVVGAYFEKNPAMRQATHVISKFSPDLLANAAPEQYYSIMKARLEETLQRLHTDYLDGCLLHNSRSVYDDAIIAALARLRSEGAVKNIGVSIYECEEATTGIERGDLDFLQLPYSILDQRMLHGGVFRLAQERKVTLHSRSVFIQGLVLMDEEELPPFLQEAGRPVLRQLDELCRKTGLSRMELAMGFVKSQEAISHLVFGVDNLPQLKEFIDIFDRDLPGEVVEEATRLFAGVDPYLVMPNRWKR